MRGDAACPLITFSRSRAELDTPPTTQGGKLARFLSYPDPKQAVLPMSYNIDGAA
jgi:hypothetical protein